MIIKHSFIVIMLMRPYSRWAVLEILDTYISLIIVASLRLIHNLGTKYSVAPLWVEVEI